MPCRLINPVKSEVGIVSKVDLEKMNWAITSQIRCNQWRNTQAVVNWFKPIPNKTKARFTKFDIVDFYSCITDKLLHNAVSYAQTLTIIPDVIIQLIIQTRKFLLFTKGNIWIKKRWKCFNVTMRLHDSAEICELVGIYLFGKLSKIIDRKKMGLYRDDWLSVIENANGPKLDRLRKNVIAVFHNEELKIAIDTQI